MDGLLHENAKILIVEDEPSVIPSLVVFSLEDQRYALPLASVQRSIRVVAITPVPKAPAIMLGIVNLGGMVIPVIDLRGHFNHPPREVRLSDQLIVATTGKRTVALLVDAVAGVVEASPENYVPADEIMPRLACLEGVMKAEDRMILIQDLEHLLSFKEGAALDRALRATSGSKAPRAPAAAAKPKAERRKR